MTIYTHLAVVGRVEFDDEDSVLLYEHLTADAAEAAFLVDMREGRDASATVYINYVLTSDAPITIERNYA